MYALNFPGRTLLNVPRGAEFFEVGAQGESAVAWLAVDPTETEREILVVDVVFTGARSASVDVDRYVGTLSIGGLVGHAFDVTP
jgi:hypothetical protein